MGKGDHLYKHGFAYRNKDGTRSGLYIAWVNMRQRCNNKNKWDYKFYGGIGIKVCKRWSSFKNFYDDMGASYLSFGDSPTLDRINVLKGYSPKNCRWASRWEQSNNRSYNRVITFEGKTQSVGRWAKDLGVKVNNLHSRLYRGWSVSRSLSQPFRKSRT